jgi:hypothetical protein
MASILASPAPGVAVAAPAPAAEATGQGSSGSGSGENTPEPETTAHELLGMSEGAAAETIIDTSEAAASEARSADVPSMTNSLAPGPEAVIPTGNNGTITTGNNGMSYATTQTIHLQPASTHNGTVSAARLGPNATTTKSEGVGAEGFRRLVGFVVVGVFGVAVGMSLLYCG